MFEQVVEGGFPQGRRASKALWQRPLNLRFLLCTDIDHGRAVALGQLGELGRPAPVGTGHARNQHTASNRVVKRFMNLLFIPASGFAHDMRDLKTDIAGNRLRLIRSSLTPTSPRGSKLFGTDFANSQQMHHHAQ